MHTGDFYVSSAKSYSFKRSKALKRLPRWLHGEESACQYTRHRRWGFDTWVRKIPWRRRKWQPTPAFLLGKCHGLRSLVGYSPWRCKESDTTEPLSTHGSTWGQHRPCLSQDHLSGSNHLTERKPVLFNDENSKLEASNQRPADWIWLALIFCSAFLNLATPGQQYYLAALSWS